MADRFPAVPDLTGCLRQLLAQVPAGWVTTCGNLADALGNRIAARWVGHWALHHEHGAGCTCHRILRAGGQLGGYVTASDETKRQRLLDEGIAIDGDVVDLERFGFRDFVSNRPLEELRRFQEAVQRQVVLRPRRIVPKLVGAVDVAYPSPNSGVAAYALVETETGRLVWSATIRRRVAFPYISTYLSFREIPIYLDLLDEVRAAGRLSRVLLVDGSGILHHRHVGIASHLGVVAKLPTVGVTKKLLCGSVDIKGMASGESRPVVHQDQLVGVALRPTAGSQRPIFISPGHLVDVAFGEQLVRRLLTGRRLPEPLYWADRLSKTAAR
ncbi:MAG: endonuclease V [Planctomycetaceae bacterium]|nr:endonuclease V [Planctomycetaceae bacterium]